VLVAVTPPWPDGWRERRCSGQNAAMEPKRTDLAWTYQPTDFFEAPFHHDYGEWRLSINDGRVVASSAGGQPAETVENDILDVVKSVFRLRMMQCGKRFSLHEPASVTHFDGDNTHTVLRVNVAESVAVVAPRAELLITNARTGAILHDSKATRIAAEHAELNGSAAKAKQSSTLRRMLASFEAATNDRANALVHLFEVRDAIAKHFGKEDATKTALGISSSEWSTFGRLTNDEPLLEGRHRGKHSSGLRHATHEELATVRDLARDWIRKFAATL
jgi:hypothetical protein